MGKVRGRRWRKTRRLHVYDNTVALETFRLGRGLLQPRPVTWTRLQGKSAGARRVPGAASNSIRAKTIIYETDCNARRLGGDWRVKY